MRMTCATPPVLVTYVACLVFQAREALALQSLSAPVIKTSLAKEAAHSDDAARSAVTDGATSSQQQQASNAKSAVDAQKVTTCFGTS